MSALLRRIYALLPDYLRRQLVRVLGLMLLGAALEALTLGAVIPFLTIVTDPNRFGQVSTVLGISGWLAGWTQGQVVTAFGCGFIVVALVSGLVRTYLNWSSNRFVFAAGQEIASRIYARLLDQNYAFHLNRNSSESVAAVVEVITLTRSVVLPLMQATTASLVGVAIVVALLIVDPLTTTAAALGFGLLYVLIAWIGRRRLARNSVTLKDMQARRVRYVQEALGGIRDIILDHSQPMFTAQFDNYYRRFSQAQAMNAFLATAPRYAAETGAVIAIVGLALLLNTRPGGVLAALPTLGALALGAQRLLPLMQQLYTAIVQLRGTWDVADHVLSHAEMSASPEFLGPEPPPVPFGSSIDLRDVTFRYRPDLPPVLDRVAISIAKGAMVGIVGPTGSGKSTLLDLIMGLQEPSAGAVLIDGVPLTADNRRGWHRQIAHVPQAIFLADTTILENIAFGVSRGQIDRERAIECARKAHIHEFIAGLPEGYDSTIGERGARISGGQRQRIGIARALYKGASVLVLDEATSALDQQTEREVSAAIEELSATLTVIIVAHRLTTVAKCDQIIRVEKGNATQTTSVAAVANG